MLPDIGIIEFEGIEDNKIEITKIQKTSQEKDLDMEQEILDKASLLDLQNTVVKALKALFKYQRVM